MTLKDGFYTALGTPLDEHGGLVEGSLKKHVESQIEAGASGLLLMGSMGNQATVRHSTYARVVDVAIEANAGRLPLFVGAMDNSIARVMERIEMIGAGKAIEGIVLTTPFYSKVNVPEAIKFFRTVADSCPYPIYLYDLAAVTQFKINMQVIDGVITHGNVKGIKTADWELIKEIGRKYPDAEFNCLYSGLDSFDYANAIGITKNLDGMFCCTPKNGKAMYECVRGGDLTGARRYLDNILLLRNTMVANNLMASFTYCMNLLGMEGSYNRDYTVDMTESGKAAILAVMKQIGEI